MGADPACPRPGEPRLRLLVPFGWMAGLLPSTPALWHDSQCFPGPWSFGPLFAPYPHASARGAYCSPGRTLASWSQAFCLFS